MNTVTEQLCSLVFVHKYPALVSEKKGPLVWLTGDNPTLHTGMTARFKAYIKTPTQMKHLHITKLNTVHHNIFMKSIKDSLSGP